MISLLRILATAYVCTAFAQQPRIDSITPSQGPISGGFQVTINGANLAGATVRLDSTIVSPIAQSGTSITLQMPAHDNGYVIISARSSSGSAYGEFLYVPPRLQDLPAGYITTVAGVGPYVRDFGPATNATIAPAGLALAPNGSLYIAEPGNNKISRVRADGTIERVTSPGSIPFFDSPVGDGGPSELAHVSFPRAVAVDAAGNVYIPDQSRRIRRIDAQTGVITTIAGNGMNEYSGDGGPAVQARLKWPSQIAADAADVFFIDADTARIRRIQLSSGIISTYAGNGTHGFSGDGGPATSAQFNTPNGDLGHLALDPAGNLYLADSSNYRIRRIDRLSGVITTFYSLPPFGSQARDAVNEVRSLAFDRAGNLYYGGSGRIVKLSPQGAFLTAWGNGTYALAVEGSPAASTGLGLVLGIAIDSAGNILFSNDAIGRVQRIDIASGNVFTVAGIGPAIIGETGPATATVVSALGMAAAADGGLVFGDANMRLRRLDPNGTVRTIGGTGSFVGQQRPAPALSTVMGPPGVAFNAQGEIELAEFSVISRIDGQGIVRDIVGGTGECRYAGDGGPATQAFLCQAWDAVRDRNGNLIIADTNNNRIRRVDAGTGVITTIVGNGGPVNGYERYGQGTTCGNGGPALSACINTPLGVAVDPSGNLFISEGDRIRKVDASGTISTFAAIPGIPQKLVTDAAGNLYLGAAGVIRVDPQGRQTFLVGDREPTDRTGFSGDGGPASAARTNIGYGAGIAIDREGNLYFSDLVNQRIRAVRLAVAPAATPANYTALWWSSSEPGWGVNLNHQGDTIFATLYTYDATGAPMWLFMSNGDRQSDGSYQGALYRATGPAFNASPWGSYSASPVGSMRLAFSSANAGTLTYSVNGVNVTKSIATYQFSSPTTCSWTTSDRGSAANYQDLWWNPAEPGWGVNLAHQGNIVFATLYTYDQTGRGLWLSSDGARTSQGSYSGTLYRSTGPAFNASPWGAYALQAVGTMAFTFTDGKSGTLTYSVNGTQVVKPIQRFVYATPQPLCGSS